MDDASFAARILIIEEDTTIQAAIAMPLFNAGYVTATTRHKEEALAVLIEQPYDAVIIDPFTNEELLELLGMLRTDALFGYPRVIIVTSHTAQARDALAQNWADAAFDKDTLELGALGEVIGELLRTP